MRAVNIAIGVVGGLVALFLGGMVLLPKELDVERSIDIDAPIDVVFDHVNDLEKGRSWNPWAANDDTMQWTIGEPSAGAGAWYTWESENSGSGTYTITVSQPTRELHTKVEFDGMGEGRGTWTFERIDLDGDDTTDVTRATWAFTSNTGPFGGYVNLYMGPTLSAEFDQGLALLEKATEGYEPPPEPEPEVEDTDGAMDTDGATDTDTDTPTE